MLMDVFSIQVCSPCSRYGSILKPDESSELLTFVILDINCTYKLYIFCVKKKIEFKTSILNDFFSKFEK